MSDSRLGVAIFENGDRGFDRLIVRGDDSLIFLNQCGDADALRGAERVVGGGAVVVFLNRFRVQRFSLWRLAV